MRLAHCLEVTRKARLLAYLNVVATNFLVVLNRDNHLNFADRLSHKIRHVNVLF